MRGVETGEYVDDDAGDGLGGVHRDDENGARGGERRTGHKPVLTGIISSGSWLTPAAAFAHSIQPFSLGSPFTSLTDGSNYGTE
jgi:hypothetical protein